MSGPTFADLTAHYGADEIPWAERELPEGIVAVQILRVWPDIGMLASVLRMPPGLTLLKHRHLGPVHGYTAEGRWRYLEYDWVAGPGSYHFEPPGGEHTLSTAGFDTDMVLFTVTQGAFVNIGPDGEELGYEDVQSSLAAYVEGLEEQGKRVPDHLVF